MFGTKVVKLNLKSFVSMFNFLVVDSRIDAQNEFTIIENICLIFWGVLVSEKWRCKISPIDFRRIRQVLPNRIQPTTTGQAGHLQFFCLLKNMESKLLAVKVGVALLPDCFSRLFRYFYMVFQCKNGVGILEIISVFAAGGYFQDV